ncbi:spore coat protein [Jeotgalibacillus sp. S-D1]|uniref:spore coat protein n=1 Tax=Jeotgalibacillus sp. S-D1 TaxID=2552189 RepID=UPI001059C4A5|nr:spore coat protein [Jeotgalibacillus sp. S-D1]TDL30894.1 spore coat protein [Jeotgalibacillus sp. S-D1]
MQNNSDQPNPNLSQTGNMAPQFNHGGHEIFDAREVLSLAVGVLDQYTMFREQIKDQQLKGILDRQFEFLKEEYNVTLETFTTGKKPSHSMVSYNMAMENDTVYGLTPMPPVKPVQSANEINDQGISGYMLGLVKSGASLKAMTALEMTNPVLRRVVADSVPNWIEMAYELFLYQNKHHYYQVPQLSQQDMQQLLNSYSPASGTPNSNNMMQ